MYKSITRVISMVLFSLFLSLFLHATPVLAREKSFFNTPNNSSQSVLSSVSTIINKIQQQSSDIVQNQKSKNKNTTIATSTAATTTPSKTPVAHSATSTTSTTSVSSTVNNTDPTLISKPSTLISTVLSNFIPEGVYTTPTFSRLTTFILVGLSLSFGLVGIILASGKLEAVEADFPTRVFRFNNRKIIVKNQ